MIIRRAQSGLVIFQEAHNKATYATTEQVAEVLEFPFDEFPTCWEFNSDNQFFDIHPIEGWYQPYTLSADQLEALESLEAAFEDIKAVEGVTGDQW